MLAGESQSATGVPNNIAEYLLSHGMINESQALRAEALAGEGGPLGAAFVSLGYLADGEVAHAYASWLGIEYVDLSDGEWDPELIGIVGEDVLVQRSAVPVRVESGRLVVAMRDPADPNSRGELTVSAGQPVIPAVAPESAIFRVHGDHFGETDSQETTDSDPGEDGIPGQAPNSWRKGVEKVSEEKRGYASTVEGERLSVRRPRKLGEILISEGRLTSEQLNEALSIQKGDSRDLGEILISLGLVDTDDLARALATRLKLDYVVLSELSPDEVDPETLRLIDGETLRKYNALPLRFEGEKLIVAMSNPNDLFALEDLRIITGHSITPVVATVEDLHGALAHLLDDVDSYESPLESEPAVDYQSAPVEIAEPPESSSEPESIDPEIDEESAEEERAVPSTGAQERPREDRRIGGMGARIGRILVSEGKISAGQLEEALAIQRENRGELGGVLLSLGYVNEADLARALATRLRLEFLELSENDVEAGVLGLIEQKVLRRHRVLPLRLSDGRLVVAMSDPTNIYALEDLMMISGYPVTPVVALEEEIRRVQNKVFAVGDEVTEILQDAATDSVFDDAGEVELGGDTGSDDAPIVRLVGSILQQAVGEGASDVHVEPRARELTIRFRVDGVLRQVMSIPPKLQNGVIARLKILSNLDIAERRVPQDGRFSVRLGGQKIDLRVASLPTVFGEKVVLRLLDTSNVEADLGKLGFRPEVFETYEDIFRRPYGAILVTGPTGSGKSTTLYATLGELNSPERNIITVEDPVEYRMQGINQIQVNVKAGLTFASGLRSILRADPDVVMIGEIRDRETAKISVEAALTGHLVLATLHTNNAPSAVNRLTDMGVEPFLTSSAVDCVIAQRLARRLCDRCKRPFEVGGDVLSDINFPFEHAPKELLFREAVGCERCGGTGYRGRVGIYEMMVVSAEIKELILRRASTGEISRVAAEQGMIQLRDDGLLKAAEGMTTIEEVLRTVV